MTDVVLPKAFKELFEPSRYKAYFGGRGSAKSHSFAQALVVMGAQKEMRILCCREIQRSIKDSVKRLVDDKIKACGLEHFYTSTDTEIRGKNGTIILFAGLKTNPEAIKSMEGIDIAWVEEANKVTRRSLDLLIPTIRKENSELWFSWNPDSEFDPVDLMFRGKVPPPESIIKRVNVSDNPWFPDVLKLELEHDKKTDHDKYAHIWLGEYRKIHEGAYYRKELSKAEEDGRITSVPYEAHLPVHTTWDIGIGDATAIWFWQEIGDEIRFIDYYEASGEGLTHYAAVLQHKGYVYGRHTAPHDIEVREFTSGRSRIEAAQSLGIRFDIAPKLSVEDGINSVRLIFNKCWFDAKNCSEGLRALRNYRAEYDEKKLMIKVKPLHDWASHGCFCRHTKVFTKSGYRDIVDVEKGELVFTPIGWSKVLQMEMTGVKRVQDFLSTKATSNHPVLTQVGFLPLKALTGLERPWSVSPFVEGRTPAIQMPKGSMIDATLSLLSRKIEATGYFTETFGDSTKGRFQKVIMFITLTTTIATTLLRILRYSLLPNMARGIGLKIGRVKRRTLGGLLKLLGGLRVNGMAPQMVLSFTNGLARSLGKTRNTPQTAAERVMSNMSLHSLRGLNSAASTARCECSGSVEVYNLKTDSGMYTANNVVVSNSDSMRYVAVSYRKRVKQEQEPLLPSDPFSVI